jgi:hypothetical protein
MSVPQGESFPTSKNHGLKSIIIIIKIKIKLKNIKESSKKKIYDN